MPKRAPDYQKEKQYVSETPRMAFMNSFYCMCTCLQYTFPCVPRVRSVRLCMHVCTRACGSEGWPWVPCSVTFTSHFIIEAGFLPQSGVLPFDLIQFVKLASWLTGGICLHHLKVLGLQGGLSFYVGAGDPNLSTHASVASPLSSKASP